MQSFSSLRSNNKNGNAKVTLNVDVSGLIIICNFGMLVRKPGQRLHFSPKKIVSKTYFILKHFQIEHFFKGLDFIYNKFMHFRGFQAPVRTMLITESRSGWKRGYHKWQACG